jgi:hypothetical protein
MPRPAPETWFGMSGQSGPNCARRTIPPLSLRVAKLRRRELRGSAAHVRHDRGYVWLPEVPDKPQQSRWISKNIALVEQIR